MKISARNVLEARIVSLTPGPVNTEVRLALAGGDTLVAVISSASADALGLAPGGRATAIVKAPWVMLAAGGAGQGIAGGNALAGSVSAVRLGPVNAEVALTLAGGSVLHAVVTRQAVAALGLAPGAPARALIKASDVVLAV